MIQLDLSGLQSFVTAEELEKKYASAAGAAHALVEAGNGPGGEMTGWLHLPSTIEEEEIAAIERAAARIRADSQVLVCIGIGGSYLGARAVYELLAPSGVQLLFAGNGLSAEALSRVCASLEGRDFSLNVISKSGTTTEPAIAFRVLRALLEARYGEAAASRIYVTADRDHGALRDQALAHGYERFVIPAGAGGRYSVLSAVGLLPLCAAGVDIRALLAGARRAEQELSEQAWHNPAWQYASARRALYGMGKHIELLSSWEPTLRFFGEWWKQLFAESEGKEGQGIFPASLEMTADLHSLGQYVQQGERILFETMLRCPSGHADLVVPASEDGSDGLGYLEGRSLAEIADKACAATKQAHIDGGVPCLEIAFGGRDAQSVGELLYFFELSCALSGYMSGINPFDQPGVEAYKTNMFRLLGKPGYTL